MIFSRIVDRDPKSYHESWSGS